MKTPIPTILLVFALSAFGQSPVPEPVFPDVPLPVGIVGFVSYNQLGDPQVTGGLRAIYPVVGKVGVYGTTGTDFYPKLTKDPATGRSFYALQTMFAQEFHKDLHDIGRWSFLIGGGPGLALSTAQPSGINVNLSGMGVFTSVFQINKTFSLVIPIKGVYITGAGWNLIPNIGLEVKLAKSKP